MHTTTFPKIFWFLQQATQATTCSADSLKNNSETVIMVFGFCRRNENITAVVTTFIPIKRSPQKDLLQLLRLPKYSILPIVTEWLSLVEVCLLDSSLSNKALRMYFKEISGFELALYRGLENVSVGKSYLLWLKTKNYAVLSLQLDSYIDKNEMEIDYNLKYLHMLRKLTVRFCTSSTANILPKILSCCVSLTEINLTKSTCIKDRTLLELFTHCHLLRLIDLSGSGITDSTLIALSTARCSSEITSLNLSHCEISDTGLLAIADNCSSLQTLSLNSQYMNRDLSRMSRVSDKSLVALSRQCRELTTLSLCCEYFPDMTETGMITFIENASSLTSLTVSQSYKYSDKMLVAISDNTILRSQLKELDISRCNQYTALGMTPLAQFCTGVTCLNLDGCVGINYEALMVVAEGFPLLVAININSCEHAVLDAFVHTLCKCHILLTDLSVSHATRLTSSAIDSIVAHCKQIKALNIGYNHKIDDDDIINLINNCTSLTNLSLRDTQATVRSILHAVQHAPRLLRLCVTGSNVSESDLQTIFTVEESSLEVLFCKLNGGATTTYYCDNFRIVREY